jgi:anti-sigma factor RsiW
MSGCQTDGDLRAYVDRELPGPDRERVASHLAACGECEARYRVIEARAARVAAALGALTGGIVETRARPAAPKARMWPRWAAAGAIAAGLAVVLVSPQAKAPAPAVAERKGAFIALDNEPIDAGLVVRVSMGPGNVQADVIVSTDGRARAYRLVSDSN